ncbi:MAG: chalcone isomerase family protein [Gemmatimonadaceae bacterium]
MRTTFGTLLAAAVAVTAAASPVRATAQEGGQTLNGVTLPREVQVEGQALQLNGMALRKKAMFKVYVAGLYLPARTNDANAILAADAPRRLVLQFVRGVGKNSMCDALSDGLRNNTPDASAELKAQFETFCGWMEDIEEGEQFVFTYLPGSGTTLEVKGQTKGTIPGKEFADALFKSWIGPKPGPGDGFKRALLGRE